jgi:hypothetical protein
MALTIYFFTHHQQADEFVGFYEFLCLGDDKAPLWKYRRVLASLVGPANGANTLLKKNHLL